MVQLKPGDRINCRIKQDIIVGPYQDHDEICTFEIVAADDHGYYLFVPQQRHIKGSFRLDNSQSRKIPIDRKFIGSGIIYIAESLVYQIKSKLDGMPCVKCKDFFFMAEANQPDGTLICYSCRLNPYR